MRVVTQEGRKQMYFTDKLTHLICKESYKNTGAACLLHSYQLFVVCNLKFNLQFNLLWQVGRQENVIGWYHSHPGYGCWLSGIDVSTQMLNQNYQEPFVAIVIDPIRTISSGKVNIGAFRTYPKVQCVLHVYFICTLY